MRALSIKSYHNDSSGKYLFVTKMYLDIKESDHFTKLYNYHLENREKANLFFSPNQLGIL